MKTGNQMRANVIFLLLLVLGCAAFYAIGGLRLAIVYLMLWIDKIILWRLVKIPWEFGIELFSIPAIIVGIAYGPLIGFLFAFFILPFIGSIFDIISAGLAGSPLVDTGWELFIPSPDSFILGLTAIIGGFLGTYLSFFYVVVICAIARFFMQTIRGIISGTPFKTVAYVINLGLNIFIGFLLSKYLMFLFA